MLLLLHITVACHLVHILLHTYIVSLIYGTAILSIDFVFEVLLRIYIAPPFFCI